MHAIRGNYIDQLYRFNCHIHFHIIHFPCLSLDTSPLEDQNTVVTGLSCPFMVDFSSNGLFVSDSISQINMLPSKQPAVTYWPSGENEAYKMSIIFPLKNDRQIIMKCVKNKLQNELHYVKKKTWWWWCLLI
jgi:hypothetical protein